MRRILALLGFIAVLALAVTLLYRVYRHHTNAEPYGDDDPISVERVVKTAPALA